LVKNIYYIVVSTIVSFQIAGDVTTIRYEAKQHAQMLKNYASAGYTINIDGKDLHEIYVCVDDILYKTNSALEATDVCFKAFQIFNVKYPSTCEHLWLLIQKDIYMFDTIYDAEIPHIQNVLSKILKSKFLSSKEHRYY